MNWVYYIVINRTVVVKCVMNIGISLDGFWRRQIMKKVKSFTLMSLLLATVICLSACGFDSSSVKGPLYLIKHYSTYNSDGSEYEAYNFEYDEHGNTTRYTKKNADNSVDDCLFSDFDANGYYSTVTINGTPKQVENSIKNGLLSKSVDSKGITKEYDYYRNGKLKSCKSVFTNGNTTIEKYDENGRLLLQSTEGNNNSSSMEYKWETDSDGQVTGYTRTDTDNGKTTTYHHTCKCDDYGNVINILNADGKVIYQFDYVKIDNPSIAAWTGFTKKGI